MCWGGPRGSVCPCVCFGARMLLWDSFLSKDTLGQGLKPGNAQSHTELLFFPDSSGQKKSLKYGGSWPPVFGMPDFPVHRAPERGDHPSPNDRAFHPSPKKPSRAHPLQIWEAASPKPVITFPRGVGLSSSLLFFFFSFFPFKSKPGKASDVGTTAPRGCWGKAVEGISQIIKPGSC